ncbi:hypothetical protein BGZ68_003170 [Mortierella alpina]|nr:hypothetical protein BGZ68_003170 [Mortierella alpina]
MGKLTSLLKKKKSRGDGLTSSDLQEKAGSTLSGISVEAAPLSLCIPATSMGEGTSSDLQASLSLMDDIMDELAGTTPDTPQPTLANPSSDFSDFGHVFEFSRQFDQGTMSTDKHTTSSSGQSNAAGSNVASKVGKLEQNRALKDNAFLRSQQQNRQSNTITSTSSTYARLPDRKAEEAERAAEAVAKLREASKKVNAQLPSDDEGSSSSDSDGSDDGLSPRKRRQQQQQLLQMQQQAMLQQQQQQQQQMQQQSYQTGEHFASNAGSPRRSDGGSKKPRPINHEAVIDRMKDRHRALLAGAAAAARDEFYEEYMDDYDLAQQLQPPGPMAYNMQYGVDPSMMYGVDEFRMKQQPQPQQYFGQGALPSHQYGPATPPLSTVLPAGYSYTSSGPMSVGYNAGAGVYQGQPMSFAGSRGPAMHPNHNQGFAREYDRMGGGSDVSSSHSNSVNNGENMMPTRQRFRQQSTASSARASEDSWADPYPVLSSTASAQKPYFNEFGNGGMAMAATTATTLPVTQEVGRACEDSILPKDPTPSAEDDLASETSDATVDDITKIVEDLSIAQVEATDAGAEADTEDAPDTASSERDEGEKLEQPCPAQQQITWSDGSSETFEAPDESLKGSTANESGHHQHHLKESSSPTTSAHEQESNDCDSSDDDQPIILSRRGSARGPFPFMMPAKTNMEYPLSGAGVDGLDDIMPVSMMMNNQQIPFIMPQNKPMYQPVQTPSNSCAPQHAPFVSPPLQYMPMGYPFPGAQPAPAVPNLNMGHHHSYSMDRIPASIMMGPMGNNTMAHMARRGSTLAYPPSSCGPKDLRQAAMTANGYGAAAAPIQSPYPIPPTTLLHPLPRRTQSARLRSQNPAGSPSQQQQQFGLPPSAMMRGRSSLEYARCMPNGSYQAVPSDYMNGGGNGGGGYMRGYGEPLSSPPQQYQQQLQMQYQQGQQQQQGLMTTSPPQSHNILEMQQREQQQLQQQLQQQQQQQGCFIANSHFGYGMHPSEAYMIQPHQQPILQAARR